MNQGLTCKKSYPVMHVFNIDLPKISLLFSVTDKKNQAKWKSRVCQAFIELDFFHWKLTFDFKEIISSQARTQDGIRNNTFRVRFKE